jgi:hypothetical protein
VAGEPELPERLEVVSWSGDTRRPAQSLRQEPLVGVLRRGPGGDGAGAEVDRYDEADKSRAAEMSSSKSGTSTSS